MVNFTSQTEPVHHIIVTSESHEWHFWYFLADSSAKAFDKVNDKKLVEQLHKEGVNLKMGGHAIIKTNKGHEYRLSRLDSNNYTVQSLSAG